MGEWDIDGLTGKGGRSVRPHWERLLRAGANKDINADSVDAVLESPADRSRVRAQIVDLLEELARAEGGAKAQQRRWDRINSGNTPTR